ncbi:MAG: proton-conducting transporter membrane subunit [Kiritimatiellia bacterium]|jgi:hydrogenase-4 component B|nr:proton-conducting transporter membrane subunit [Kiritimatiellia bacterium]
MNGLSAVCVAALLMGVSGGAGYLFPSRSALGQCVVAVLLTCGSAVGLSGCLLSLTGCWALPSALNHAWSIPGCRFAVGLDALSAVFLLPVFVLPALGAWYGLAYWRAASHPANARRLGAAYGALAGAMALVVIARDGVLFLIAWEAMALAAYFAATVEDDRKEVRRAGWIYLVATHAGTLCLLAFFAGWRHATGSFMLEAAPGMPVAAAAPLFLLALVGFGFKAGLMPAHVWLPGAHANAPSHVSAVMSGVMLKMGIYGIVRAVSLLPVGEVWWGGLLLAVGAVSCVGGIAFAIGQRDIKRLLAYSSIENVGIIALGLGLALTGRASGRDDWVVLGLCGALLHVWNHGLFKGLLFLNAGALIHATGTRDMEVMGGLAKRAPRMMMLFAVGAVAICALPPFNGFVSEWLLYAGFFCAVGVKGAGELPAVSLAAVALAMTGALAVACFVNMLARVYLGTPRSETCRHAHDPEALMLWPMVLLAGGCVGVGLFPAAVMMPLEAAAAQWGSDGMVLSGMMRAVPFSRLSTACFALAALTAALAFLLNRTRRARGVRVGPTWDCGYARPTARMQYSASSFGDGVVGLASFLLWPRRCRTALRGLFPRASSFKGLVPDTILDRLVLPAFRAADRFLPRLRVMQQGRTHVYVFYILAIMIVLLLWGGAGSH